MRTNRKKLLEKIRRADQVILYDRRGSDDPLTDNEVRMIERALDQRPESAK